MNPPPRRLTTRRGSLSASDPWAKNIVENDTETSSRLSIMRVGAPPAIQLKPPPPTRLSFASSFGNKKERSSSPRRASQSVTTHAVTPDELMALARPNTITSPNSREATFTPLPDDILLPFIDRPSEVAALISSPPSARLFALLQLTFNASTHVGLETEDAAKWSYAQLVDWLTKTNRDTVPDALWAANTRRCILAHSETIWERVKGALGVPVELDVDALPSDDDQNTSDLEDDGMKARGHWDDWDAVMDSPVFEKSPPSSPLIIEPILSSPSTSPFFSPAANSTNMGLNGILEEEESSAPGTATAGTPEEEGILPSQIHGIRISTSPTPSSPTLSPTLTRPGMDIRRPSFGSSPMRSSPSFSPLLTGRRSRPASISSFSSLSLGPNSVEERSSPLFPSSFAALKPKVRG